MIYNCWFFQLSLQIKADWETQIPLLIYLGGSCQVSPICGVPSQLPSLPTHAARGALVSLANYLFPNLWSPCSSALSSVEVQTKPTQSSRPTLALSTKEFSIPHLTYSALHFNGFSAPTSAFIYSLNLLSLREPHEFMIFYVQLFFQTEYSSLGFLSHDHCSQCFPTFPFLPSQIFYHVLLTPILYILDI